MCSGTKCNRSAKGRLSNKPKADSLDEIKPNKIGTLAGTRRLPGAAADRDEQVERQPVSTKYLRRGSNLKDRRRLPEYGSDKSAARGHGRRLTPYLTESTGRDTCRGTHQ